MRQVNNKPKRCKHCGCEKDKHHKKCTPALSSPFTDEGHGVYDRRDTSLKFILKTYRLERSDRNKLYLVHWIYDLFKLEREMSADAVRSHIRRSLGFKEK